MGSFLGDNGSRVVCGGRKASRQRSWGSRVGWAWRPGRQALSGPGLLCELYAECNARPMTHRVQKCHHRCCRTHLRRDEFGWHKESMVSLPSAPRRQEKPRPLGSRLHTVVFPTQRWREAVAVFGSQDSQNMGNRSNFGGQEPWPLEMSSLSLDRLSVSGCPPSVGPGDSGASERVHSASLTVGPVGVTLDTGHKAGQLERSSAEAVGRVPGCHGGIVVALTPGPGTV